MISGPAATATPISQLQERLILDPMEALNSLFAERIAAREVLVLPCLPLAVMGAPASSLQKHLSLQQSAQDIVVAMEQELLRHLDGRDISNSLSVLCQRVERLVSEVQNTQQLTALAAPIEGYLRLFPNNLLFIQRARLQIARKLENADLYASAIGIYADIIRKLSNHDPANNDALREALSRLVTLSHRPLFDIANQIAMRELQKLATIKACPAFRFHYLHACLRNEDFGLASTAAWQIIVADAQHTAPYPHAEIVIRILADRRECSRDLAACLARVERQFPQVVRAYWQSLRRAHLPPIEAGDDA